MRDTTVRLVLRTVAVVIAIAALFDPVLTLSRPAPQRFVVARLASAGTDAVAAAIRSSVPGADVRIRDAASGRVRCMPDEQCVVVADGSIAAALPDDIGHVSLVRAPWPTGPNVAMLSAVSSRRHNLAGAGQVRVSLSGTGVTGRRSEIRVIDGGATVGAAEHTWTADGQAAVDVPWWPLGDGPRALRVAAMPLDGEASALDNTIEVGVTVSSARARVLVFDARPSWASAFVRRALEDDARFQVEHRVGIAPSLAAGTAGARLDSPTLDAASVVVVGGPENLSASDVTLLDRFVRRRGGTLILVPDRAIAGAATELVSGRWTEHLEAAASAVGPLRASETLRLSAASPVDVVLGSTHGLPAIVLSPSGYGRVVMSGALDAWRYRDTDSGAFDRFWRSLVLESAAASAALRVEPVESIVSPGARVPFVVRHHRMADAEAEALSASARCGDGPLQAIRLWPSAEPGVFSGTLPADAVGSCVIRVAANDGQAVESGVAVTSGPTASVSTVLTKLERAAASTGGVVGDAEVVMGALTAIAPAVVPTPVLPMRSPWWMSLFVACLGLEWWLRRRAGLR